MKRQRLTSLHILAVSALAAMMAACASIGRPTGGPRDLEPPEMVRANPMPGQLNVDRTHIDIFFNENVQLDDAFNKIIVSPAQKNTPVATANGRHLQVDLKDSLLDSTTYTIYFADAIRDLNESNILDDFAYDFSTGPTIDSLRISGMVLEARTLEPAQSILVGAYTTDADSAISTTRLERVTRTNQYGQFTIRNLKPGTYYLYAVNDINRDYHWDRSEDVAFLGYPVSPSAKAIQVTDTLRSWEGGDSLVERAGTAFLPNDLLLCWFNEGYQSVYLRDKQRPERRKITIGLSAPVDSLPTLTIVKGPKIGSTDAEWSLLRKNATLDSLEYWITDPDVLATDSLKIALRYLRTDTTELVTWTTDTLDFVYRDPKSKKKEKKDEEADSVPKIEFMSFSSVFSTSHDVYNPLLFQSVEPIDTIYDSGYRLELKKDTLWVNIPGVKFVPDSLNPLLRRRLEYKWEPGEKYRLTVDSAAVYNVYGLWNNKLTHEFTVKNLDEYTSVTVNVTGQDSLPMIAELLDRSDKVIAVKPVVNRSAKFQFLPAGEFYVRLYIDADSNGIWSTGNIKSHTQPEDVFYYPKKIKLKKNWDIEIAWNIYETAVDLQKPYAIKKNKPKLRAGEKAPGEEEEEEDDGFGQNMFNNSNNSSSGNKRTSIGGVRKNNIL